MTRVKTCNRLVTTAIANCTDTVTMRNAGQRPTSRAELVDVAAAGLVAVTEIAGCRRCAVKITRGVPDNVPLRSVPIRPVEAECYALRPGVARIRQLENCAVAVHPSGSALEGRAVEIALRVEQEIAVWDVSVLASGKAVQDLFCRNGLRRCQLVDDPKPIRSTVQRRPVERTTLIEDYGGTGETSVGPSRKAVKNSQLPSFPEGESFKITP